MNALPILHYPDFLSPAVSSYLKEISVQAGRRLYFANKQKIPMPFSAKAAMFTVPNECIALIFVNPYEINERNYQADRDDPILAHEVTHLELLREGWARMRGDQLDQPAKDKVRLVENFLTDPIVNQRISVRGFSLKEYIETEAKSFTERLKAGNDRAQFMALALETMVGGMTGNVADMAQAREDMNRMGNTEPIGHFMTLYLDHELADTTRDALCEAFRLGLPKLWEISSQLIKCVEENGFGSPSQYRQTALLCLQHWGVNPNQVEFAEFVECTTRQQENWAGAMPPEQGWNE